jgi:DNA-binding PadR family transcriptional regulator
VADHAARGAAARVQAKPLTQTSYAILALLDRFGELSSYDLKSALEDSIQDFWPIPHTTAYQEPVRLRDAGYVSANQEEGGRRRRQFALTDAGRRALQAWVEDPFAAPPQMRDELQLKIFAGADARALIDQRIKFCEDRISQLEASLKALDEEKDSKGAKLALRLAVGYNDGMFNLMQDLTGNVP